MKKNNGKRIIKNRIDTPLNKDNIDSNNRAIESLPHKNKKIENVLILQGGGSLGAFGCGVFKAIANNNIKLDIIAGTYIGGVNAAILAGSKDEMQPELALEQFRLELSENFVNLDRFIPPSSGSLPNFIEKPLFPFAHYYFNFL
jgi:predicted acylesterase/phospholipase RssA